MVFDRKAYQRSYMKGYMQKRRAPWDDCVKCLLYNSYCDGGHKVKVCPKTPHKPTDAELKEIHDKEYGKNVRKEGSEKLIMTIPVSNDTIQRLMFRMKDDEKANVESVFDSFDALINRLLDGPKQKNYKITKKSLGLAPGVKAKFELHVIYGCSGCDYFQNRPVVDFEAGIKEPFMCIKTHKRFNGSPDGVFPEWCTLEDLP